MPLDETHTHFSITTVCDVISLQLIEYCEDLRAGGCIWMGGKKVKGKWENAKSKYWAIAKEKKIPLCARLDALNIPSEAITFTPITIVSKDQELTDKLEKELADLYKKQTDALEATLDRDDLDEETKTVMLNTVRDHFDEKITSTNDEIIRLYKIQKHKEDRKKGKLPHLVSEEESVIVNEMNKTYMILNVPTPSIVEQCTEEQISPLLKRVIKRRFLRYHKRDAFKLEFEDTEIMYKNKMRPISEMWVQSPQRRHYHDLVFRPDKPALEYEHNGKKVLNTWEGWQIKATQGNCDLFKFHILKVICSGDQDLYTFVFKLLAHWVQRPLEWTVSPVIRGKQGSGKGVFTNVLMEIFGNSALECGNHEQIFGRFNAAIMGRLLIHLNEALFGGDRKIIGRLKMLVTESKVLIELKGKELFSIENHAKLIITSNEDFAIPVDAQDRRFLFLDTSDEFASDPKYFEPLLAELKSGGIEAFFYELTHTDLTGFNAHMLPEVQNYGFNNKIASEDSFMQYLHTCLQEGTFDLQQSKCFWSVQVKTKDLYDWYLIYCERTHSRSLLQHTVGRTLSRVFGTVDFQRTRDSKLINEERAYIYKFPALEIARQAFAEFFKSSVQSVFPH